MNWKKYGVLAVGTLLLLGIVGIDHTFRFAENILYDLNFVFQKKQQQNQVAVVGIDAQSMSQVGVWPWPRSTIAQLVNAINNCSPRAVAIDVVFIENKFNPQPGGNDSLVQAFKNCPALVLPFRARVQDDANSVASIPPQVFPHRFAMITNPDKLNQVDLFSANGITAAESMFCAHARYGGFINVTTSKTTQKLREAVHVIRCGNEFFPSFGLASVAAYYGASPAQFILDGKPQITIGTTMVPLTRYAGTLKLNFRGRAGTIPTISAADLLSGQVDPALLRDKLVFIGITDPLAGAADFFITPVGSQFPGVEVWATAALDIIQKTSVKNSGIHLAVNIILMLLLFPGLALFVPAAKKNIAVVGSGAVVIISILTGIMLFRDGAFFWNAAGHVYAFVFGLGWLALQKSNPGLIELKPLDLESATELKSDTLSTPSSSDFLNTIPDTVTARYAAHQTITLPTVSTQTAIEPKTNAPHTITIEALRQIGDNQILHLLGSGGMADVYLTWNPRLEVYRAVKVLKPEQIETLRIRFETEVKIFSKFNHPNIVRFYAVGQWYELPYVEMEYVHGASIEQLLKKLGNLSSAETLAIGILICRALYHAHKLNVTLYGQSYTGIIHRDLKPANIMISKSGHIKLTDFGISRPDSISLHTKETTTVVGTLPYLAPEQVTGATISYKTDLYSMGITLYELVTGKRAFPQSEIAPLIKAKCDGTIDLQQSGTAIAPSFLDVLKKATTVNPDNRYDSALSMEKALEKALRATYKGDTVQLLSELSKRYFG